VGVPALQVGALPRRRVRRGGRLPEAVVAVGRRLAPVQEARVRGRPRDERGGGRRAGPPEQGQLGPHPLQDALRCPAARHVHALAPYHAQAVVPAVVGVGGAQQRPVQAGGGVRLRAAAELPPHRPRHGALRSAVAVAGAVCSRSPPDSEVEMARGTRRRRRFRFQVREIDGEDIAVPSVISEN